MGLIFMDESSAETKLSNVSMFRLKNYFRPLQILNGTRFKRGTTFEQAYSLYEFDSELRRLIAAELEKIEISVRTRLSYILADQTGDPFWFLNPKNFRKKNIFNETTRKLGDSLKREDDFQIVDFRKRYPDPYPPSWVTMEITTFGTLSMLYENLIYNHYRKTVAHSYGLSGTVMESWLHTMIYVRNICAHHSRLWNRELRVQPMAPRGTMFPFLKIQAQTNRVYYVICIILYFLVTVNPQNDFAGRIDNLTKLYPHIDVCAMGFPTGWRTESLWQK